MSNEGECIKTTKQSSEVPKKVGEGGTLELGDRIVSIFLSATSRIVQVPHRDISGLRGER